MKKRMISLLLVLSFLLPVFPAVRAEEQAAEADIETLVAEQFDAFAKSLKPEGASEGAAQLVKHSIKGGGDLNMDADDKFTKAIMNTQLLREFFIHTATDVHDSVLTFFGGDTVFMRGSCTWYQNHMRYGTYAYHDNENDDFDDDEKFSPRVSVRSKYEGSINTFDEAMMLVAGDTRFHFTFRPVKINESSIRYRVTILSYDTFDFSHDGDYKGDDRDLEEFITWAGTLLSLGLLTTFDWTATVEFDLELPNTCPHVTHDYRWEYDGIGDLVNVTDDGNSENPLTKTNGSLNESGAFYYTRYITDSPIILHHSLPWVLEYRSKGGGYFAFANRNYRFTGTYLYKSAKGIFFGEQVYLNETDEDPTVTNYGVTFPKEAGISSKDYHTYTLKNHVDPDGSNMVYLYVDGVEIGPMNGYHHGSTSQGTTSDWINGRDFLYQHIGTNDRALVNLWVEYIQVWENGEGNEPYSFLSTQPVTPTCTADGGTLNTCSLCGAEFMSDVIPATGHDYTEWEIVKESTCTVEGKMERSCRACGQLDSRPIAVTAHSYTPILTSPTCTAEGYTTYTCECGDSYVADQTEALGHDLTAWQISVAPTCTESGTEERRCQRCDLVESRVVDATGHRYEAFVTEPSCTVGGYTDYICECGDSYRSNYTSPKGHSYETVVTEPGCTVGGFTTYTCACGDSYRSNFTSPRGHQYEAEVTEPGCTDGGYTTYTCFCGDSYRSNFTTPKGHAYEDGICTRCGGEDPDYEAPVENPFTDVPAGAWYEVPVLWALENNITTGESETTFNPSGKCLRAQVVTFLWRAAGSPIPSSNNNPFVDVKPGDFYYEAVLWAVENGITNGVSTDRFGSYDVCNRAAVVTFLWRAAGSPEPESTVNPFSDVNTTDFFYQPVLWAVENDITNGLSPTQFGPTADCNRAQVVTFLYRDHN